MSGQENTPPTVALRCLTALPPLISMFTTLLLDLSTYRNLQNHPNPNQRNFNNRIHFHITNNSPWRKSIETSIVSTTISVIMFVIFFLIFIIVNIFGTFQYYVVAITFITFNAVRIPLVYLLTLNKNETNAVQSKAERQETVRMHALEERQRREEANNQRNDELETAM